MYTVQLYRVIKMKLNTILNPGTSIRIRRNIFISGKEIKYNQIKQLLINDKNKLID